MSLPERFNPLITAWDSVPVENQSQVNLIEWLIKEEQRLTAIDTITETLATANITKRKEKQNSNKKSDNLSFKYKDKKSIECYFCHKLGHYARDCRKRKGLERFKDNNNLRDQKSNEQKSNENNCSAFIVTEVENDILNADTKDIWLLDSGASKHMSFQRNWFTDYHTYSEIYKWKMD